MAIKNRRAAVILLTLIAVGCSTASYQVQAQQASAETMTQAGGECRVSSQIPPIKQAIARAVCENRSPDLAPRKLLVRQVGISHGRSQGL
jgi:hypothetical protein